MFLQAPRFPFLTIIQGTDTTSDKGRRRIRELRSQTYYVLGSLWKGLPRTVFVFLKKCPVLQKSTYRLWDSAHIYHNSTRVDDGRKGWSLVAIKMKGRTVVGMGEESLLCYPESELRLGRREKRSTKTMDGKRTKQNLKLARLFHLGLDTTLLVIIGSARDRTLCSLSRTNRTQPSFHSRAVFTVHRTIVNTVDHTVVNAHRTAHRTVVTVHRYGSRCVPYGSHHTTYGSHRTPYGGHRTP